MIEGGNPEKYNSFIKEILALLFKKHCLQLRQENKLSEIKGLLFNLTREKRLYITI